MKRIFFLILISLTLFYFSFSQADTKPVQFTNLTDYIYKHSKPVLDKDLQEVLYKINLKSIDDLKTLFTRTKLSACMLIMRTSLNKGNKSVSNVMKTTKHEKTKTFDKIVAMMLDTCTGAINDKTALKILNSEDPNIWEGSFEQLLIFNKNVFQIIGPQLQNTPSEKSILDEIQIVMSNPNIEQPVEEDQKMDFLTEKLGAYKYFFFGSTIGFVMFLFFVFFYSLLKKK